MSPSETLAMRRRARISARRFTDEEFEEGFGTQLKKLIGIVSGEL